MNEFEMQKLMKSWVRLQNPEGKSQEHEDEFWSFERLNYICRNNPEEAWRVIVAIYESRPGEVVLSNLAAGPVEDLLVNHGPAALEWISGYCTNESGFFEILKMVWQNSIAEETWDRLQRLIKRGV